MSIRPYIIEETPWKVIKDTAYDLAVLPWGATEAHNLHLPFATDNIIGEYIAGEAARIAWEKGVKTAVLPVVPFGVNTTQLTIKLDINMNPSTQMAVLNDVVDSLNRQGIRKLVVLNSHGGNDFRQIIRELHPKYPDMFICVVTWWNSVDISKYFDDAGDHAGEFETSALMYFAPQLVLPLSEAGSGHARQFKIPALKARWAWAPRDWLQVTKDTGIGNPAKSTAEKGRKCMEAVTQNIAKFFVDLAKSDLKDMYE